MARILMIPLVVILFYTPAAWSDPAAAIVFILAAVTDSLDGYLARKLGQTSALGAFLDPVADKLMVAVVLVFLLQQNPSPWLALPAAIIIGREITISALREWMAELGVRTRAAVSSLGKIKTTAQMVALITLLYREPIGGLPLYTVGFILLYVAAVLTLWSMCVYLWLAWPVLRERNR